MASDPSLLPKSTHQTSVEISSLEVSSSNHREFFAFRQVPKTGVIYVSTEAAKCGFSLSDPDWCNLGQGQPETGPLPDAPERMQGVLTHVDDFEYAPVGGIWELREEIASLYNKLYRRGLPSQYSAENVCISGGGRVALSRAIASLNQINLGFFLPDYTAYEELIHIFQTVTPIPLWPERGQKFAPSDLRREIVEQGLSALLFSNPSNPTGKLISGEELAKYVHIAREWDCMLLLDEFYSHYIYCAKPGDLPIESAAKYVSDVDRDPVVLFDGLTKNWRYPGLRVTWALGPKSVIESFASAGSFLDGGGSRPLQRAVIPLLSFDHVVRETLAIEKAFRKKRDTMVARLKTLGVRFDSAIDGTFYAWGDVSEWPPPLNNGMGFFRAALAKKVIVVPGEFFDLNPGKRRNPKMSHFKNYVRFSFGPKWENMDLGLTRLEELKHERT